MCMNVYELYLYLSFILVDNDKRHLLQFQPPQKTYNHKRRITTKDV